MPAGFPPRADSVGRARNARDRRCRPVPARGAARALPDAWRPPLRDVVAPGSCCAHLTAIAIARKTPAWRLKTGYVYCILTCLPQAAQARWSRAREEEKRHAHLRRTIDESADEPRCRYGVRHPRRAYAGAVSRPGEE